MIDEIGIIFNDNKHKTLKFFKKILENKNLTIKEDNDKFIIDIKGVGFNTLLYLEKNKYVCIILTTEIMYYGYNDKKFFIGFGTLYDIKDFIEMKINEQKMEHICKIEGCENETRYRDPMGNLIYKDCDDDLSFEDFELINGVER